MQNSTKTLTVILGIILLVSSWGVVLATGVYGPNLIKNPGFEEREASGKPRYWDFLQHTPNIVEGGSYNGTTCVKIDVSDTASPYVRQPRAHIKVQAGSTYVLSAMVKPENIKGRFQFKFEWYDKNEKNHAGEYCGTLTGSGDWQELTVIRQAPPDTVSVSIYLRLYGPGTILIDDVSLRKYDELPPNPVEELRGRRVSWTSSAISWLAPLPAEDGDLAAAYNVYRSKEPFIDLANAERVAEKITAINWTDEGITSESYYYAVTALDELGLESAPKFVFVSGVAIVSGRVLDEDGKGLGGVTLEVLNFEGEYRADSDGFYTIPMVEEGLQTIRAIKKGYRWAEETVVVEAGEDLKFDFYLIKDGEHPPAPLLLKVNNEEPGLLWISWEAPDVGEKKIAGYNIYRSTQKSFSNPKLIASMVTETSYFDLAVHFQQEYWYAITVIDTALNESGYSEILGKVVLTPSRPLNLSPENESKFIDEAIEFTWDEVANYQYYILEVASDPQFPDKTTLKIEAIGGNSYPYQRIIKDGNNITVLGLPDGRWYWRVRAKLNSGVLTQPSIPSTLISVNTQYRLDDVEPGEYNLNNPKAGQKSIPVPYYQVAPKTILNAQDQVEIAFVVATQLPVFADLTVYNMAGKPITNLVKSNITPGLNIYSWNGKDNQNRHVANGLYLVRLQITVENQKTTYMDKVVVMR